MKRHLPRPATPRHTASRASARALARPRPTPAAALLLACVLSLPFLCLALIQTLL
ncbi:hypothetical protein [Sagittula sp. S175]|uniref:hypothetical protein n=1 Tax=Sagittula sp. S175 TaxID=3415129 RepID=UPI003C7AC643